MFQIRIADLNIDIDNKYNYIEKMCQDYISNFDKADFRVDSSDELIKKEEDCKGFPLSYIETLAVYRAISENILSYDAFLMHGVVASVEGEGVAFLAKSGTGKSTHAALWLKLLSDKFEIINGDKPIVRCNDGVFYAYGTPWAGKEGIQVNKKVPLRKICFIERSLENETVKIEKKEVLPKLMCQVYMPKVGDKVLKTFDLIDKLVKSCEFYVIRCNKDISAAQTAYNEIFK